MLLHGPGHVAGTGHTGHGVARPFFFFRFFFATAVRRSRTEPTRPPRITPVSPWPTARREGDMDRERRSVSKRLTSIEGPPVSLTRGVGDWTSS